MVFKIYLYMGVSKNNGTPKSSHFNRLFHYFHHPLWGFSPYFGVDTHIYIYIYIAFCNLIWNLFEMDKNWWTVGNFRWIKTLFPSKASPSPVKDSWRFRQRKPGIAPDKMHPNSLAGTYCFAIFQSRRKKHNFAIFRSLCFPEQIFECSTAIQQLCVP